MTATRLGRGAVALLAVVVLVAHLARTLSRVGTPSCASLGITIVQARAWNLGLPLGDTARISGLDPECPPAGFALYQPAFLAVQRPLADASPAAITAAWTYVQVAAWVATVIVGAWVFRSRVVPWLAALAVWVVALGSGVYDDLTMGALGLAESALLWTALALASAQVWAGFAAVVLVLGSGKIVWWGLLGLLLPARRWRELAVALAVGLLWVGVPWVLWPEVAAQVWTGAMSHDERGVIHPSLRSLVFDVLGAPRGGGRVANIVWLALSAGVAGGVWWRLRRRPDGDAWHPDAVALVALGYFAVTPYLKDYTVPAVLPALAWATVRAPWPAAAGLVALGAAAPWLGGYAVWWCVAASGLALAARRDAAASRTAS